MGQVHTGPHSMHSSQERAGRAVDALLRAEQYRLMILLARARAQRVAGVTAELCAQLASLSAAMPTEDPRRLLAQVHTPSTPNPNHSGLG